MPFVFQVFMALCTPFHETRPTSDLVVAVMYGLAVFCRNRQMDNMAKYHSIVMMRHNAPKELVDYFHEMNMTLGKLNHILFAKALLVEDSDEGEEQDRGVASGVEAGGPSERRVHASASEGGTKATEGGAKAAVGGTKAAVRGTKAAVGGTKVAVGGTKASVGETKAAVGGTKTAMAGDKAAEGGAEAAGGGVKPERGGARATCGEAAVTDSDKENLSISEQVIEVLRRLEAQEEIDDMIVEPPWMGMEGIEVAAVGGGLMEDGGCAMMSMNRDMEEVNKNNDVTQHEVTIGLEEALMVEQDLGEGTSDGETREHVTEDSYHSNREVEHGES